MSCSLRVLEFKNIAVSKSRIDITEHEHDTAHQYAFHQAPVGDGEMLGSLIYFP